MSRTQSEVRYWFEQAINVSTRERRAFIERNCADDDVRAEVLSLVEYDSCDTGVADSVRNAMGEALGNDDAPVVRVGPFQLGKLLGSGGMGLVYEGRRVDGNVEQRVAVKFAQVSPTATDEFREQARRRFLRERQTLASLRHPYIAGLIDAGTTERGIPYAVIEQVDGVTIDAYCERHLPADAERIRLFLKLCDAVQFAHRNLVVHSDIKPENVLVTADGIPKLIDFGVASEVSDETSARTLHAFTPGYASPEQSLGLSPTVATDVYGLGAVLYRLLTGAPPRRLRGESLQEALRSIAEEDPVSPSEIRPDLKGDLENILLKALQREPGRRYGSVPEFAEDLNRYLARRPVRATPDSMWYRSSRFIRRHRLSLGAATALASALVIATSVSLTERQHAVKRAEDTRRLAERLLFEVHDQIGNSVDGTRARERVGEIAVQYLERSERDWKRDPELAWELLNAYSRLAQSRGGATASIGDSKSAVELAVKALALGQVVENANPSHDRVDKLFSVYGGLVPVFLEAKRRAEQREAIERLMRLAPRLDRPREAEALKQLARFFDDYEPEKAVATWMRALSALRTVPMDSPAVRAQLISTVAGCGRAQAFAGELDAAAKSLYEADQLLAARIASEPPSVRSARQSYWIHITLGDVFGSPMQFNLGRTAEAIVEYRKARDVAEQLKKADPASDTPKLDLARVLRREALTVASSQPAVSLALLKSSREAAAGTSPRNYSGLEAQYFALADEVVALTRIGQLEPARARLSEAQLLADELRRERFPLDQKHLLKAGAALFFAQGRKVDALEQAKKQLALMPSGASPVLGDNRQILETLDQVRNYASGIDLGTCEQASQRVERLWRDLRAAYPGSVVIRAQAELAQASGGNACVTRLAAGGNTPAATRIRQAQARHLTVRASR